MTLTKAQQARVDKAMAGEYIDHPTAAEKAEIELRWFAAGRSNADLGRIQGWNRKTEPVMYREPKPKTPKISSGDIQEMREAYQAGEKRADIARRYGISPSGVQYYTSDITQGRPTAAALRARLKVGHEPKHGWQEEAACIDIPVDAFFPSGEGDYETIRQARRICSGCPVAADCLTYAIKTNSSGGIFGGVYLDHRGRVRAGRAA